MFIVQLVIFQVFIFALLVVLLRYVMGKNVTNATSGLQKMSGEYIKKEEALKREYNELREKYKETIEQAKKEAMGIRDKGQEQAKKEAAEVLDKARMKSEQIIKRAEKSGEQIKKDLDKRILKASMEKATMLIGDVLPDETKKSIHEKWTKNLIKSGFSSLSQMNIPEDVKDIRVITPYTLTPEDISAVKADLVVHLKKDIFIKEEIDETLIAGIVVVVGSVFLDGSLLYKAKKIAEEQKKDDE